MKKKKKTQRSNGDFWPIQLQSAVVQDWNIHQVANEK